MPDANEGLVAVLSKLDEDTLLALAKTVTQGLKRSNTTEEAIGNIIKYSSDEISILRRKAVTRDLLFNYLDENNVKVRLPTTKNELIDRIAELWNIPRIGAPKQEKANSEQKEGTEVALPRNEGSSVSEMADQFSKWFYEMLNANDCGPEHFFEDAKLKLNMYINDDCDTTVVESDTEEIINVLLKTKSQYNLFFNINDSKDGIQGRMDPHGLVIVLTCGTLHVQSICAGVFEQVFALARDPFSDNNWKIKNTELNLRSKNNVLETPKLCDSNLTCKLLELPLEESESFSDSN